jgi:hypothetical protein
MAVPILDIAPDALLEKTNKGIDEIKTRANKLGLRLRTVLIMVNGLVPMQEIHARAAILGNADAILSQLVTDGFVKVKVNVAEEEADPLYKTQKLETLKIEISGAVATAPAQGVSPSSGAAAESLDFSDFTPAPMATTEAAPSTPGLSIEFAPPPVPAPAYVKPALAPAPSGGYDLTKTGSLTTLNVNAIAGLNESEALAPVKFYIREQVTRVMGAEAGPVLATVDLAHTREELLLELELFIQIMQDLTDPYEAASFKIGAISLMPD